MCSPESERGNGAAFYVGKVRTLNCIADMMHVIWYWPKMPHSSIDAPDVNGTNDIQVVYSVRGY